jgi:hypothetical protein
MFYFTEGRPVLQDKSRWSHIFKTIVNTWSINNMNRMWHTKAQLREREGKKMKPNHYCLVSVSTPTILECVSLHTNHLKPTTRFSIPLKHFFCIFWTFLKVFASYDHWSEAKERPIGAHLAVLLSSGPTQTIVMPQISLLSLFLKQIRASYSFTQQQTGARNRHGCVLAWSAGEWLAHFHCRWSTCHPYPHPKHPTKLTLRTVTSANPPTPHSNHNCTSQKQHLDR